MDKYYVQIISSNKAKNDLDELMRLDGWKNVGSSADDSGKIKKFFIKLGVVLKAPFALGRGGVLLIQYPFKKYYVYLCRAAHMRGCKVITLIHDLGSFRRQKLTPAQEVARLSNSDYIIVHNPSMMKWLEEQGCRVPMGNLEIFDYLSETVAKSEIKLDETPRVVYAGGLGPRKNAFLYDMDKYINNFEMNVYGKGLDEEVAKNWKHIHYKGFMPSDELISTNNGHFGLVWDGDSMSSCSGNWGEYLKYNNPHKTSFYIRCHLPIIIWNKAALAPFVKEHNIGICVDSLQELDERIKNITPGEYKVMYDNILKMSKKLSEGYYFYKSTSEATDLLFNK